MDNNIDDVRYIEPEFSLKYFSSYFRRLFTFEAIQDGFINKTPQILDNVHEKVGSDIKKAAKKITN